MKLNIRFAHYLVGMFLLCGALGATALTLGKAKGAAMLGQPLQLTVPIQLDAAEGDVEQCFAADVYYGDAKQDPSRVEVSVAASSNNGSAVARIDAYAAVSEPVVTVYLRMVCGQKTSRKYVFLADLASELAPPVSKLNTPVAPLLPVAKSDRAATGGVMSAPLSVKEPTQAQKSREVATKPAKVMARVDKPKAKLRLAATQMPEGNPALKISKELPADRVEDLEKRVTAIADWRSLNSTPEDVLKDEARLQAMEVDVKKLAEQTSKSRNLALELGTRLEESESQSYTKPLAYGLAAVLLACLSFLGFMWFRMRQAGEVRAPWWRGTLPPVNPATRPVSATSGEQLRQTEDRSETQVDSPTAKVARTSKVDVERDPVPLTEVDIDLELGDSAFAAFDAPVNSSSGPVTAPVDFDKFPKLNGPASSAGHAASAFQAFDASDAFDVCQQAEFFVTLGQYDEAISLLTTNINESQLINPLVYLDLLKVFHTLSRKDEFERYRAEFNRIFNGNVPTYMAFNQRGKGLEHYADMCVRISELWPQPAVGELIESYMVRNVDGAGTTGMDLEAFMDLLMLHEIVERLKNPGSSKIVPFGTLRPVYRPEDTAPLPVMEADDFSVDLDLTESVDNLIDFDMSGISRMSEVKNDKS